MASYALIRPEDDADARQASTWADSLGKKLSSISHNKTADVDAGSPPDQAQIVAALGAVCSLICYFGHGDKDSWLTGRTRVKGGDFVPAKGKAVISIACKTGCNLAPDALTAGVRTFLAFSSKVAVIAIYNGADPIGDAIVDGLSVLSSGSTMQQSRDEIYSKLDGVVNDYDTGQFRSHPAANFGYFAAMAMRDHIVVHGDTAFQPL
jgi:hypothetical protein